MAFRGADRGGHPPHASRGRGGLPPAPGTALDAASMAAALDHHPARGARPYSARGRGGHRGGRGGYAAQTAPPPPTGGGIAAAAAAAADAPLYDAYVVLDFEATCERDVRIARPEIIEFPLVIVDPVTRQIVAEFQRYVRPKIQPQLSEYCTELTGITQETVDAGGSFASVLTEALDFLSAAGLGDAPPARRFCFVTCGDWDLRTMLPKQLSYANRTPEELPASWQQWCNLKIFMKHLNPPLVPGRRPNVSGMMEMLRLLNLQPTGRHHSGIDDCRNIAAVLCELLRRGYAVGPTWPRGAAPPVAHTPPPAASTAAPPAAAAAASAGGKQRPLLEVDEGRNPLDELLPVQPGGETGPIPITEGMVRSVSKCLSHILRHSADKRRIAISANGFSLVDDLLREPQLRKMGATPVLIARVVQDNNKQRFTLAYGAQDGRLYIAANQGHSLEGVQPNLHAITRASELPLAVHGTYVKAWELIQACGYLSTMTRQHIHFAKGLPSDSSVISGMRSSAQVLLFLDVERALEDGVQIYESVNGVILTPGVGTTRQLPLRYVKKAVNSRNGAALEFKKE